MHSGTSYQDDLTVLKGIGPARQQWLRTSFDVQTFADLAALAPEDIEARLKKDGQIARRRSIEEWIGQAKVLAEQAVENDVQIVSATLPHSTWRPFASFVVEMQARQDEKRAWAMRTAVQHIEADNDATWHGVDTEKLYHWMGTQIEREVDCFDQANSPQVVTIREAEALVVQQVEVWQPVNALLPQAVVQGKRPLSVILEGQKPFLLKLQLDSSIFFRKCVARLSAYNLRDKKRRFLGSISLASMTQFPLTIQFPTVSLQMGQYRLVSQISTLEDNALISEFELPFVQVI